MNMTPRDRLLLMLLPGLLLFMAYVGYFFTARQKPLAKLQADVEAARTKVPSPAKLHERGHAVETARKSFEKVADEGKKLQTSIEALVASFQSGSGRSQRITQLTSLLNARGLRVMNHTPTEGGHETKALHLSPAQERLVKQLTESGKPAPQTWQFELVGKFADLTAALQEIGEGDVLTIPLGVTMDETLPNHRWSLLVWI